MARADQVVSTGASLRAAWVLALLVGLGAAGHAKPGLSQARPAEKKTESPPKYDQYEPSRTRRMRAEVCGRDEESIGAYCVKVCQGGYVVVPNSEPPRCRSIEPLAEGQLPSGIRKEIGDQPKLPPPAPGTRKPQGGV